MPTESASLASRRKFLQFVAASTALTCADARAFAETLLPKARLPDQLIWAPLDADNLITDPKDAINVFDFEPVMRQKVPPAHFGYMASGVDDCFGPWRSRQHPFGLVAGGAALFVAADALIG
jgi:4-hydroxymandelate oxidase